MTKRCRFCGYGLDTAGLCQNQNCADYVRTKIIEAAEKPVTTKVETNSTVSS